MAPRLLRAALLCACGAHGACVIPKLGMISVDAGSEQAAGDSGSHAEDGGGGGGAGSGGESSRKSAGAAGDHAGQGGSAGQGGMSGAGTGGTTGGGGIGGELGGRSGAGGQSAGAGGGGGQAGSAGSTVGPVGCTIDWGSVRGKDGDWTQLGTNPGFEMNSQASVEQYICRATPPGMREVALGKGVPGFGCYATYASGNTRVGFGVESGFYTLLPITGCQTAWKAASAGFAPLELGAGSGLYACRGQLQDEPYSGGTASGTELGQWIPAAQSGGTDACWTQFHGGDLGVDAGSKLLTTNVEVLVALP